MQKTKVFFSCSTTMFIDHAPRYRKVIQTIKDSGFDVISNISIEEFDNPIKHKDYSRYSDSSTYQATIKKMLDAQIVVIDASVHSMTLGVLLAYARANHKPCLLITKERKNDTQDMFVSGATDSSFTYEIYSEDNISKIIEEFLRKYTIKRTNRVNFVLDSDTLSRLDWLAFRMHTSKTEIIKRALSKYEPED